MLSYESTALVVKSGWDGEDREMETSAHYTRPHGVEGRVLNGLVVWLTRRGLSLYGSRILRVRGRASGLMREVPVNVLTHEGRRYLVAPRGQTQWVRNLRAAGTGELVVGRKVMTFEATEVPDEDKVPLLRDYLERWGWEVGRFFEVGAKAKDAELRATAPRHPVFEISPR